MSDHPKGPGHCACCNAREAAIDYFNDHVGDGEIGDWVNGTLDAVAIVAAGFVIEGREREERDLLVDILSKQFDRAVINQAAESAQGATRQ